MQNIECMKPCEIVGELDRHIIGQNEAKKAVAIALRNRYRRKLVEGALKEEIVPKNILMVGPTGVGKTEIARRIAKLTDAPFVKVEATNFTEIGYVGKDVDSIIKDLTDSAVKAQRKKEKIRLGRRLGRLLRVECWILWLKIFLRILRIEIRKNLNCQVCLIRVILMSRR